MGKTDIVWDNFISSYTIHIRLERSLSPNTVEAYLRDVESFARFVVAQFGIEPYEVEQSHIEQYMGELYHLGLSASSSARHLSSIKSLFEYLLIEGDIDRSPAEYIATPHHTRHLPDLLTVEQIDATIDAITPTTTKGQRDRAIIEMLYSCGLRASELLALRLSDLFFGDGYLRVVGKGEKERLVPLSRAARERVELYLSSRGGEGINTDILFLNNRGRGLTRAMIFTIVRRATAAAGITAKVSPHTFRHSFATHLLEGGASIREVQEMLGHESITTTEIYTHVSRSHLRDAVKRLL